MNKLTKQITSIGLSTIMVGATSLPTQVIAETQPPQQQTTTNPTPKQSEERKYYYLDVGYVTAWGTVKGDTIEWNTDTTGQTPEPNQPYNMPEFNFPCGTLKENEIVTDAKSMSLQSSQFKFPNEDLPLSQSN